MVAVDIGRLRRKLFRGTALDAVDLLHEVRVSEDPGLGLRQLSLELGAEVWHPGSRHRWRRRRPDRGHHNRGRRGWRFRGIRGLLWRLSLEESHAWMVALISGVLRICRSLAGAAPLNGEVSDVLENP